jgi:hypothetical protein
VSKGTLKNVRIFSGGADLTGQSNKIEIAAEIEEKDVTNFASVDANGEVWKEVTGGIASAKVSAAGQWEAGDTSKVDDDVWAALGGIGALTTFPVDANVGSVAWIVNAMRGNYQLLGAVGDVAPWSLSASSSWPAARGVSLHPPGTARTATGNGTGVQQGAITAGRYGYASLHVLSVAGTSTPTITVKIQSDDNSGFTTATDQITFTAATVIGGQIARVAGPITDDYWRAVWTISGSSPSFLFVVGFGIK